jgi:hypothetical protein
MALRPVGPGTHWSISKDISDYASLFLAPAGGANASLTIPNTVTAVYTGVQYIRATATFHSVSASAGATIPPVVLPLLDPAESPWDITGLKNASQVKNFWLTSAFCSCPHRNA